MSLAFSPQVFQILSIEPGNLFGSNPLEGKKTINIDSGSLEYALARTGPTIVPTAAGTFATITLKVVDSAPSGSYALTLTSVGLADHQFNRTSSIQLQGATFTVQ